MPLKIFITQHEKAGTFYIIDQQYEPCALSFIPLINPARRITPGCPCYNHPCCMRLYQQLKTRPDGT